MWEMFTIVHEYRMINRQSWKCKILSLKKLAHYDRWEVDLPRIIPNSQQPFKQKDKKTMISWYVCLCDIPIKIVVDNKNAYIAENVSLKIEI